MSFSPQMNKTNSSAIHTGGSKDTNLWHRTCNTIFLTIVGQWLSWTRHSNIKPLLCPLSSQMNPKPGLSCIKVWYTNNQILPLALQSCFTHSSFPTVVPMSHTLPQSLTYGPLKHTRKLHYIITTTSSELTDIASYVYTFSCPVSQ